MIRIILHYHFCVFQYAIYDNIVILLRKSNSEKISDNDF